MKKVTTVVLAATVLIYSCNSGTKDSVEKADSTNKAKMDSGSNMNSNTTPQSNQPTITTDAASSAFLVKVADVGMAEVQAGQMAQQKAMSPSVKNFADMMVTD